MNLSSASTPRGAAQDVLRRAQPLDAFFKPRSVAVIGATETVGSVGRTLLTNLLSNPGIFDGNSAILYFSGAVGVAGNVRGITAFRVARFVLCPIRRINLLLVRNLD